MSSINEVRIVFISDVHVGSNYAIFPPDFINPEDGSPVPQNPYQKQLYREWEKIACKLSPVDIIILLGDLTEGPQTKEKFGTLKLPNIQHQAEAFIQLFSTTWKWKKLYVIRGTDYHVASLGVHIEEYIARRLGAEKIDADRYSAVDLTLKVAGKSINAAHHVGVSQVPHYRFTPLAREMWLGKLFDDYFGKVDIVARGHVHYFLLAQIENIMRAFTCPCWQLPTPYQRKRTVFGSNPSIGLVEVEISHDGEIGINPYLLTGFRPRSVEVGFDGG
jgi:DNA polymerase II small subunit/DNA polymerase delta subunit B